jgi:hypothetical protein
MAKQQKKKFSLLHYILSIKEMLKKAVGSKPLSPKKRKKS